MKAIELFAGAGGLAMGSSRAGFDHQAVVEWDAAACETIRENQRRPHSTVSGWPLFEMDVNDFEFSSLQGPTDLVAGGPPCQPFSMGGKHRGHKDERDMFPQAIRAVRERRPQAFIFENVKGLLRSSFSSYFEYILLRLSYPELVADDDEPWMDHLARLERCHTRGGTPDGLSYRVVFRLLNAADYGVPQTRERVFMVGFRSDLCLEWSFPKPTHSEAALLRQQWVTHEYWDRHGVAKADRPALEKRYKGRVSRLSSELFPPAEKPWRTVRDALQGLPDPRDDQSSEWSNHEFNDGARSYPGHTGSPLDRPAKTLKAGDHGVPGGENMVRYPDDTVRYFTVRESARLQTFPDDYVFPNSWTRAMRQLGNAVPVELAYQVVQSVQRQLMSQQ